MGRRHRKKEINGSMDSLLDTMFCVVGILIILLIVIQLEVKEKIKDLVLDEDIEEISSKGIPSIQTKLIHSPFVIPTMQTVQ